MRFYLVSKHSSVLRRHFCRRFATKYSGKVVVAANDGRSIAVEIESPNIQFDTRGYPLPRKDLVCKVTKILQTPSSPSTDPFLDLSDYLQSITPTLTPSETSEVIKSLKSPELAFQFFRFCSSIPFFRHDCFTYNRILMVVFKSSSVDRFDTVQQIVDEMERSGVRGNISTVNILIGIHSEEENGVNHLETCLNLVKKWDLMMNCYTYKCLLQAYLRLNESNRAIQAYKEMKKRGYKLDVFAYNMLLDAMSKNDKADLAYKVFEDMKRKHCDPDEYTYTILIRTKGKNGEANEALELFQEMLAKGYSPNLISYNTMMQGLVMSRMVDKCIFLFTKMVENNCRPNEFTYSLILTVLIAEGKLGKLQNILKISERYMNKSIYAFLVRTLTKLGHAREGHHLFCHMWNSHDEGDREAYLSMLESLCNACKLAEAMDFLDKIHEKGIICDTVMYNMVFSSLGRLKQVSHLADLYEKMKREGPIPDIFTYNILIASFGRVGRVDEAVKIFEELEASECNPDIISYNSIINCLGKNGDIDEAHMRFKEMQEKGFSPDVVTYSTLIECFGKTGRVEMACRLFDEMLDEGCSPNIVTYNILLDCLERSGRTSEAVDLYAKLKQQDLSPDSITHSILVRLQGGSGKTVRTRRQAPITGWVVSPLG